MQQALLSPQEVSSSTANGILSASQHMSGSDGLAIYQRSYFIRIASCMREQFPALCHALGEPLFNDFVAEYIQVKPPESYTLYDLGRRFPAYLEETRPDREMAPTYRETWIEFMIDLATFERQLFVMFDAPGHEGHPFAEQTTPDDHLRLQPCFALGAYQFPVAVYYHEVKKGHAPELPPLENAFVAMVRTDYLTRTTPLNQTHYVFLKAMMDGCEVDEALNTVSEVLSIPHTDVCQSWLAQDGIRHRWIETGFFIDFYNA